MQYKSRFPLLRFDPAIWPLGAYQGQQSLQGAEARAAAAPAGGEGAKKRRARANPIGFTGIPTVPSAKINPSYKMSGGKC